ncbi:MAG TPA: carbohydrate porin [Anaeromyxobacteraceae bacterium]|nr:carbohydrate porin [Anaeromyxobacteraceae bacterium]
MRLLAAKGLHDLADERWNAYGQLTYISSWKGSFPAKYTNLGGSINSLSPAHESSFTFTATLFLGVKLWPGGEGYFVPEVIAERPFSELRGLAGAIQNFELQKTGGSTPELYRSRAYLRQTLGLGGGSTPRESDVMQLGGKVDRRRLVLTLGNFSVLDFLDKNTFTSDTRQQFLSLAFMTHAAWDFASDARGYSMGGVAELYWDDWALRVSRMSPPRDPNQLPIDLRLDIHYGDAVELEHQHELGGRAGAVRLLAFRNRVVTGRFDEAIAAFRADPAKNAAACTDFNYGSANTSAPDLCWVRRPNVKVGIGLNVEQHLTEDAGVFLRGMYADGQTEVQAYTSADRSVSVGALSRGGAWGRPFDLAGAATGMEWISGEHAEYLAMGGVDGFVGDGALRRGPEANLEAFYSVNVMAVLWLTLDYQHIWNPGFNADRGPVDVFGLRLHAQY